MGNILMKSSFTGTKLLSTDLLMIYDLIYDWQSK